MNDNMLPMAKGELKASRVLLHEFDDDIFVIIVRHISQAIEFGIKHLLSRTDADILFYLERDIGWLIKLLPADQVTLLSPGLLEEACNKAELLSRWARGWSCPEKIESPRETISSYLQTAETLLSKIDDV